MMLIQANDAVGKRKLYLVLRLGTVSLRWLENPAMEPTDNESNPAFLLGGAVNYIHIVTCR